MGRLIGLEALAEELMQRIGAIVPVLPVPLICWIIREKGSITRPGLEIAMGDVARVLGRSNLHLPRDNRGYAAEAGLDNLAVQIGASDPEPEVTPCRCAPCADLPIGGEMCVPWGPAEPCDCVDTSGSADPVRGRQVFKSPVNLQ